jgi:peptidoglycan DL-endopeptidase CwlO
LGLLDTLAGAVSFSDLINRLDLLEKLSAQDSRLVAGVTDYRDEVAQRKVELADQLKKQKVLAAEADKAKGAVQARLSANEKALSGKEAQIAQLEKEEAARQARIAAAAKEAARKAALAAAAAKAKAAEAAKKTAKNTSKSKGSTGSGTVTVQVPDNASASDVVSIAMQYLGCSYVWAGSSPSGFDCSGFVMYVYAKVGVSLPHSSRMQISCGKSVSSGDLKAGDLVFFGNPTIHHVGLYIGDGKMIHAAGVGKGVRIDSVWRSNYHGACRIIL